MLGECFFGRSAHAPTDEILGVMMHMMHCWWCWATRCECVRVGCAAVPAPQNRGNLAPRTPETMVYGVQIGKNLVESNKGKTDIYLVVSLYSLSLILTRWPWLGFLAIGAFVCNWPIVYGIPAFHLLLWMAGVHWLASLQLAYCLWDWSFPPWCLCWVAFMVHCNWPIVYGITSTSSMPLRVCL